ncbi:MAG: flagellar export protein FliJ [Gammaproteobacteria bacterium]|nr:MAG: flagellar export protein FliJ [Gammaproteobacteria bacterium]
MTKEKKRSERLNSVGKIASDKEQKALSSLVELKKALQQAEAKLKTLRQYHFQYSNSVAKPSNALLSAGLLVEHHRFLVNLEKSITTQEQQIMALKQKVEEAQAVYTQRKVERRAVEKAQERLLVKAEAKMRRDEQKMQDELSQKSTNQSLFRKLLS